MKRLSLLLATGAIVALGNADAMAQHWREGAHVSGHAYYSSPGWVAPRFYPRYAYPYAYYGLPLYAPVYSYPYPVYQYAPPVIVERYEISPPPPPTVYRERSYAQITPRPAPPAQPSPPPALERMTLSARELFDFDKATLRLPQPKLDEIADVLNRNPQIDRVQITGYTDRIGTNEYNLKLSLRRAGAVKAYLVKQGVPASRLVAVGKGEANPVVECRDTQKHAELIKCLEPNRRVEVEQITVERRRP